MDAPFAVRKRTRSNERLPDLVEEPPAAPATDGGCCSRCGRLTVAVFLCVVFASTVGRSIDVATWAEIGMGYAAAATVFFLFARCLPTNTGAFLEWVALAMVVAGGVHLFIDAGISLSLF